MIGVIEEYSEERGFGFIKVDKKKVFFHISDCEGFEPAVGDTVELAITEGKKGPQATSISKSSQKKLLFGSAYRKALQDNDFAFGLSQEAMSLLKPDLAKIKSNSSLRKLYESFIDIEDMSGDLDVFVQVRFARVSYQEARETIAAGLSDFLGVIYDYLEKDYAKMKQFMEVLVAYHRFYNPKSE